MTDKASNHTITVFEHQAIYINKGECKLFPSQLEALQRFYKEDNFPYYELVHNGVRFCEYVGVIQVGPTIIEVLPKTDQRDKSEWRSLLIDMLRKANILDVKAPSSSALNLKSNSVLDFYFELFLDETERIFHKGLIKQYRRVKGNLPVLKGSIQFSKQIQHNVVHQERFYTSYSTYDHCHQLNCILYKTLKLLKRICGSPLLYSRISALLLSFPSFPDLRASESLFSRLKYDRKSDDYKQAMAISRLLLLNFHPDITKGRNDVLALMFDMNAVWERFVFNSLHKRIPSGYSIKSQSRKLFWKKNGGYAKKMIPDIVISYPNGFEAVLDTKWKKIGYSNPSDTDLRQMYTYSKFHHDAITALVYPSEEEISTYVNGSFFEEEENGKLSLNRHCGIVKVAIGKNVTQWERDIAEFIFNQFIWAEKTNSY